MKKLLAALILAIFATASVSMADEAAGESPAPKTHKHSKKKAKKKGKKAAAAPAAPAESAPAAQ